MVDGFESSSSEEEQDEGDSEESVSVISMTEDFGVLLMCGVTRDESCLTMVDEGLVRGGVDCRGNGADEFS